ncbi:hypothetical protein QJQ45_026910, partial [Haematococcus lacustris]
VVALGGLAASTQFCRTQDDESGTAVLVSNTTIAFSKSISCAQQYQMEWWSIWFEFFLLVIMLGTCFVNAFDRARLIYLSYLALVTILLTQTATNFCTNSFKAHNGAIVIKDEKQSALNAAAAGTVLLCICNYAVSSSTPGTLIIFVGQWLTGIGECKWRPLELCYWPDQGALPAKGKEYPGLGYKRLRDKPPKAQEQQEQPAVGQ